MENPDVLLEVDFDGKMTKVYIMIRPGCHEFLRNMMHYYEVCIFTASVSSYATPVINMLDKDIGYGFYCLYREHCTFTDGIYVKDLTKIGRRMEDLIILDNSSNSYYFQPENAIPIISWYDDKSDRELYDMMPVL